MGGGTRTTTITAMDRTLICPPSLLGTLKTLEIGKGPRPTRWTMSKNQFPMGRTRSRKRRKKKKKKKKKKKRTWKRRTTRSSSLWGSSASSSAALAIREKGRVWGGAAARRRSAAAAAAALRRRRSAPLLPTEAEEEGVGGGGEGERSGGGGEREEEVGGGGRRREGRGSILFDTWLSKMWWYPRPRVYPLKNSATICVGPPTSSHGRYNTFGADFWRLNNTKLTTPSVET